MSDVIIGKGNLAGKGIYAHRDLKKGEVVIQYELKPLNEDEFDELSEVEEIFVHSHNGKRWPYSEPECYVNHSDDPNTYQDLIAQRDIALRDIKKGEQITTDSHKDDI